MKARSESAGPISGDLWRADSRPIRLGVSSCLLGHEVRYDGGHKKHPFLTDVLAGFVEWVPACPEFEAGMGVPREPVRLLRVGGQVRLLGKRSGADYTDRMRAWCRRRVRTLAGLGLCGYVLKKASPSCGMERVPVYDAAGRAAGNGRGIFAEELIRRFTLLPIEEEGRLNDPELRENFIERVFAYRRLCGLFSGRWTSRDVVRFHAMHRLELLAHSQSGYRNLGKLVASLKEMTREEFRARYEREFMHALRKPATRRRHINVLHQIVGYLRGRVGGAVRQDLLQVIDNYARGILPLIVPVALFRHYATCLDIEQLKGQVYLDPQPAEVLLRNHA